MRSAAKILLTVSAVSLASVLGHSALAATVSGSITGPDGKPFMGAFVVAENMQNQMTVSVLSDEHGCYHISNLPAASYKVQITATGFSSDPRTDMRLAADEGASIDFTLRTAPVAWGDLSTWQGRQLLPHTANHDLSHQDIFFTTCWQSCHSFQKRMAPNTGELG